MKLPAGLSANAATRAISSGVPNRSKGTSRLTHRSMLRLALHSVVPPTLHPKTVCLRGNRVRAHAGPAGEPRKLAAKMIEHHFRCSEGEWRPHEVYPSTKLISTIRLAGCGACHPLSPMHGPCSSFMRCRTASRASPPRAVIATRAPSPKQDSAISNRTWIERSELNGRSNRS
jgi:hypothetical protein